MHPEPGIAWVPASSITLARLRLLAPPHSTVLPFADELALLDALSRGRVAVTIVEAGGSTHDLAMRSLRRVHEAFPEQPLIAWCDLKRITSLELLDVARAGVQDIIRDEFDELRHVIAGILATATQRAASVRIARSLRSEIPRSLRPVFEYALEHAHRHLDRDAVAAGFGVSRRTLHTRLVDAGLPPTRTFLTWCRLLVASALLDQPGHTLDSVAGRMAFSDGGILGNVLRRYTGQGLNRLREGSVLDGTVAAFRQNNQARRERISAVPSLPGPSSAD